MDAPGSAQDEIRDPPEVSQPPEPPKLPRRIDLYPSQWVGIPLLLLVPLLALFGIFGESRERAEAAAAELRMSVEYPGRIRAGQQSEIEIRVENLSGRPMDTVRVTLDTAYLNRFSLLSITPERRRAHEVELIGLEPRRTGLIRLEIEGKKRWRQSGEISVSHEGGDTARVPVTTFVYP